MKTAEPHITPMGTDVYVEFSDNDFSKWIIRPDCAIDPGGTMIPLKELPVRGRVLAVGPGRFTRFGILQKPSVAKDSVIQFYFGAVKAYYPDQKRGILEDKHILAVLE